MSLHGSHPHIGEGTTLVGNAEFYDFAPSPCVCCSCCTAKAQQGRTYFQAWDNRLELNFPIAACCCCTRSDTFVIDRTQVWYYDRAPVFSSTCCCCIPFTICGNPVLFSKKPKCLCISCSDCFGESINWTPCNCRGCKLCLCFGPPCYKCCSCKLIGGLRNTDIFLVKIKGAVEKYSNTHNLPPHKIALFESKGGELVTDATATSIQIHP